MSRSQESFNKKDVRNKQEKKRKEKAQKRLAKKDNEKSSLDDMIAYVDENGLLTSTPPDLSKKAKINVEDIEITVPKKKALTAEDLIKKGVVSFFNDAKGFGFIKELDSKMSYFVHVNNSNCELKEGMNVTFELEAGPKGLTACKVDKAK